VTAVEGPVPGDGTPPLPITMTATVNLELLHGVLITPSGTVDFTASDGQNWVEFRGAPLSSCLLGLSPILGLWDETCSATTVVAFGQASELENCSTWTITATYSELRSLGRGEPRDHHLLVGQRLLTTLC
jgi:hypothetical protein